MGAVLGGVIGGIAGFVLGELVRLAILKFTGDPSSPAISTLAAAVGAAVSGGASEAVRIRRSPRAIRAPAVAGALAGLLAVVAVFAAGAYGVANLVGRITGNQTGDERLAPPVPAGQAGPLRMSVESFVDTPDFMRLKVRVTNSGDIPITVFVADSCQLIGSDGAARQPFGGVTGLGPSEFDVPGNDTSIARVVTFKGQPPVEPMKLSCSRIFGPGFDVPRSITVEGIRLTPG